MRSLFKVSFVLFILTIFAFSVVDSGAWVIDDMASIDNRVSAATLNLELDEVIDLGYIKPGDTGTVDVVMTNTGTIPGKLCITDKVLPELFIVQDTRICEFTIEDGYAYLFQINWALPLEVHNTGRDGEQITFSYSVLFENGYKIFKEISIRGVIADTQDTPTATATETVTATATMGIVIEVIETEVIVVENTPTATETQIFVSKETLTPTQTKIPVIENTPTATEETIVSEEPVELPTETPVAIPTEEPTEETSIEVPSETPAP